MKRTIQKFTRESIKACGLSQAIEAALKPVAEQFGLAVHYAGGTFDDTTFKAKAEFKITDAGSLKEAEKKTFESHCGLFNLEPSHYGTVFRSNGEDYRLTGFALSRSKFPIRGERVNDGKVLLFTRDVVERIRAAAQKAA